MKNRFLLTAAGLLLLVNAFVSGVGKTDGNASGSADAGEITVFIAASTIDIIEEVSDLFTERSGIKVNLNPASSGTLAKQIEMGAAADVFISASAKWMDYTEDLGVIAESKPFVKNRIVLIAPYDTKLKPFSLTKNTDFGSLFSTRLSMGDPAHVPAGKYAREALEYYGWYAGIKDRILPAADVRSALSVVELGEVDLGIVYETDAMESDNVIIISRFPEESHTPIEYFCAFLKEGSSAGKAFYDFLTSKEAMEIYSDYGFSLNK